MSHHHCNKCGKKIDNNRHNSAIKVDFVGENPKNININLKRVNKSIHATNIVAKTKPVGKIEDKEIIRQNQKTRSSVIPNKNTLCRYIRKVGMLQTNSPNHKYCFADNTGCISMVCETDLERPFKLIPRPIMPIRSMICTGERIFFGGFDGSVGCCGLHTKWAID